MKYFLRYALCLSFLAGSFVHADAPGPARTHQSEYENNINAVVRNKIHYKKGSVEVQLLGGMLPYDSVFTSFAAGGRFIWHISDHLGWEIVDGHFLFNNVGGFTTGLLQSKTHINNLQAPRIKYMASTNLLISPLYSKIHISGRWDIFFDLYVSLGIGVANMETVRFASTGASSAPSESVVRTAFDPVFNVGLGFKIFVTNGFALSLELRDYLVHTQAYGSKRLHSYYTTMIGLSLFIPSLG